MSNAGIVKVNSKFLARILGYKDGEIKSIQMLNENGYNIVNILVEHPTLPEFNDGDHIPITDEVIVRQ